MLQSSIALMKYGTAMELVWCLVLQASAGLFQGVVVSSVQYFFSFGYVSAFSELLQGSLPALESVWQLQSLNKTDRSRHRARRARSGAVSLCKSTARRDT